MLQDKVFHGFISRDSRITMGGNNPRMRTVVLHKESDINIVSDHPHFGLILDVSELIVTRRIATKVMHELNIHATLSKPDTPHRDSMMEEVLEPRTFC